jgi:hypothetical protein
MSTPRRGPVSDLCGHCGHRKPSPRILLSRPTCAHCQLRLRRDPQPCPSCGLVKVLAFHDTTGRAACAACTGQPAIFGCSECGREDSPYGRRCAPCVLHERITTLLAAPDGHLHPQLRPVFDALLNGERPQTTLYWLLRSTGPDILRRMAQGEMEISHAAFSALPSDRTVNYVRELLTAVGVLPAHHAELQRMTPWLAGLLSELPKDQADLLARFTNWQLLRRLRQQDDRGKLTHGAIQNSRATIIATITLLTWLAERGKTLDAATQTDLEHYLCDYPGQRTTLAPLFQWAQRTGLTSGVMPPVPPRAQPHVTLSDQARWEHVELLLHDDTIRLYSRVAGLLMLLFAQPLSRICRMRTSQITAHNDGHVSVNFDTFDLELPEPLDQLVLQQIARRGQASYVSRADHWLFPGGIPGRHLATENIRSQLVARGIQPSEARNAAMFQLAAEMPTPILAEILGLASATAVRWATLAARDWSQYAALRRDAMTE